ncbi:MAG: hypothetical protein NT040_01765 [Bacteroidetes bacterium]|nr:hypothetical protein [Bacteroidota bacterium]
MKTIIFSIILTFFLNSAIGQPDTVQTLSIGSHCEGGVIFALDSKGKHGFVAAPFDQATNAMWGHSGYTNATYMNDGEKNAGMIISFIHDITIQPEKIKNIEKSVTSKKGSVIYSENVAACICDTMMLGGYNDWYLPSINELKDMYDKQQLIGNFVAGDYCSSTECGFKDCYNIHFRPHNKIIFQYRKYSNIYVVRCIRKF